MKNRRDLIKSRLAAVLLTLVMITGSFSAFVFAGEPTDEAAAAHMKETSTEEKASATETDPAENGKKASEKKEAETDKAQTSNNKSSEDAGKQPAADAEKPAEKEQPAADKKQQPAAENNTASSKEQAISDVQPVSAAEAPESTAEQPAAVTEQLAAVTEQPAAAAEQPAETEKEAEAAQPEPVKSEAKNEGSTAAETKTVKVSYSQAQNGTVSATLKNGDSVTPVRSGDTVDLTANANGIIYFTGQPDAGYVIKQFAIKNGSRSAVIPGEKFRPGSTNQISVKVSAITGDLSFSAEFEVKKYKVELTPDDGSEGSVTVDKPKAAEGETVTVKVAPAKGYKISDVLYKYQQDDGWYKFVDIEGDPATGTYSFKMPAKDIYVEASFFKPLTVKIKESKGGTVTLKDRETGKEIKSGDEVKPYQTIVVEAKAKSGYSFDKWEFTSEDGNDVSFFKRGSYFRMRNSDVTVEAIFTKNSSSGSGSGSGSNVTYYYPSSNNYYYEEVEEPEEPVTEEPTEEEQEMLDVTPIASRIVAETVLTATTSLLKFMA